jgi:hypothetical protein
MLYFILFLILKAWNFLFKFSKSVDNFLEKVSFKSFSSFTKNVCSLWKMWTQNKVEIFANKPPFLMPIFLKITWISYFYLTGTFVFNILWKYFSSWTSIFVVWLKITSLWIRNFVDVPKIKFADFIFST